MLSAEQGGVYLQIFIFVLIRMGKNEVWGHQCISKLNAIYKFCRQQNENY